MVESTKPEDIETVAPKHIAIAKANKDEEESVVIEKPSYMKQKI